VTEGQKVELLKNWLGDPEAQKEVKDVIDELGITASDFGAAMFDLGTKREEVEGRISTYYAEQRRQLENSNKDQRLIAIDRKKLAEDENRILGLIQEQDEILENAVKYAGELRETFKDVGVEIGEAKDVTGELRRDVALLSRQDATPKFDMTPAFREVSRFQQELNRLRVPDLNLKITRTIR
jgi:chromosome segregation ATPase